MSGFTLKNKCCTIYTCKILTEVYHDILQSWQKMVLFIHLLQQITHFSLLHVQLLSSKPRTVVFTPISHVKSKVIGQLAIEKTKHSLQRLNLKLDMIQHYDEMHVTQYLGPLIGLARPFNNNSTQYTPKRNPSLNNETNLRRMKPFKFCFVYIQYAKFQPHKHVQYANVPYLF